MLTLITGSTAIPLRCDDYYIRELPTGVDELQFSVSIWDEDYVSITEESVIIEESDGKKARYIVKGIDGGDSTATIKAIIDLEDWTVGMLIDYNSGDVTPATLINAIKPAGWTVTDNSAITDTATVEEPGGTPFDILTACQTAYTGLSYRFDNINKNIQLWDLYNGQNLGAFTTRELNLKAVQYKGKSNKLVTRLYPYGRDGLSIAEVNNGLTYIDNNTYTDKVISAYWQSDSFTIAQNLKDAAIEHLKELAVPERAFSCDVVDLAATNPEKYSALSFPLFSQVALIDETRANTKIMHRVSERWRYPMHPDKNKVILSNAPKRITVQVIEALKPVTSERIAQGAVTRGRIGGSAVSTPKIADDAVTVNKIINGAVVTEKIADDAVTTNKVLNKAIELAKLSEELQIFYADIIAANAIYSAVIANDGSVTTSSLTTNYLYVDGTQYIGGSTQLLDKNTTYSLEYNSYGDYYYLDSYNSDHNLYVYGLKPVSNS